MLYIRQGATHKVVIGPVVAVGDGFTPVTTLAVSSADEAEVILHDNGTVVDISGYTFAAITTADGYYHLTLQSGISNTVGHMTVIINDDSLCLPVRADFTVLEEAVYDAMFAGSAPGYVANAPVNMAQIGGDTQSATDLKDFADAGYDPLTNKVQGVVLVDTTTTNTDMRGTDSAFLAASAPANFSSLGINASGHVSRVTLVDENTDMRGTDGAITSLSGVSTHSAADVWAAANRRLSDGTNIVLAKGTGVTGFNDVSTAQVNAEVDTALAEYGGPTNAQMEARTLLAASYGTSANQTTILNRLGAWTGTGVNTILGAFKALLSNTASNPSDIGGTFDPATDSTEAIRNRGDTAWTTADVSGIPTAIQNADAYLARGVSNVEDTADRHSVAAMVMIQTNASVNEAGTTLTAKKPSDDSTFATYTLTASAGADPVTGIS